MLNQDFYSTLVDIAAQTPDERYLSLSSLHDQILERYITAVRQIDSKAAARVVPSGRNLKQVVGHIAEWDRATLIAFGEILAGVNWPRIMSHSSTLEPSGTAHEFVNEDEFNAYFALQQVAQPWESIQTSAVDLATLLHRLLASSGLLTPARLETTRRHDSYHLPTGVTLQLPCG